MVVSARDENEQSQFVAQRIADLREAGVPLSEIAVLFRSSSHSFDLEIELGSKEFRFASLAGSGLRNRRTSKMRSRFCA